MGIPPLCAHCGDVLVVVNSKIQGEFRIRFYGCRRCGHRPDENKQVVPLEYAPPRRRRLNRRRIERR